MSSSRSFRITVAVALLAGAALVGCSTQDAGPQVVNVYSARHYDGDDEVFARFTDATGIEVNLLEDRADALLERMKSEGETGPADVFITVDAGRLYQAEQQNVFAPIESAALNARVPAQHRHPDGLWYGITKRARVIAYARDRVQPDEIATYAALADPNWKGRVLVRSSSSVYNQSLVGSIIAAEGEEAAEAWCVGLVANMARTPQGGDRDQIRAISAGEGDVAIVNSYYYAGMVAGSEEDQAVVASVGLLFPDQQGRGAHVNVSGAGVVRTAPNRENAIRFVEYLTSPEAQEALAAANNEFPIVEGTPLKPVLEGFGAFKEDALDASVIGSNNPVALRIMDRAGWR